MGDDGALSLGGHHALLGHVAQSPVLRGLAGGAAYGLIVAAISHPLDTLKCLRQTGKDGLPALSPMQTMGRLYRGVGAATAASIAFRTVPFIGYQTVRAQLQHAELLTTLPLLSAFLGGAVGGVMRGFLETPAEFIKTRQQLGFGWQYSSVLRGLGATCLRTSAVIGVYFMLFEASRGLFAPFPASLSNFASGGICSIGAWALVYPLDTAKSRIQAGSEFGIVGTLVKVFREAGITGLYAGMGAGLLRAFLANGGGMVAYGWVQALLDKSVPRNGVVASASAASFEKDSTGSNGLGADREL